MVVKENYDVYLKNRNTNIKVSFLCLKCIKEKYKGSTRPPDTETVLVTRGKCPICKCGNVESEFPTLWAFKQTIQNGYTAEEQKIIRDQCMKYLKEENE